jgi:hypothetical protein
MTPRIGVKSSQWNALTSPSLKLARQKYESVVKIKVKGKVVPVL